MKNEIKHKNYTGSLEWSKEDKCYWGKILNIEDLCLYEGLTIKDCERDFTYAVDDYIDACLNERSSLKGLFTKILNEYEDN